MAYVLPEWNGAIVGAMHRIGVSQDEMAAEMGVSRSWVSRVLNSRYPSEETKRKFFNAVMKCAMKRGIMPYEIDPLLSDDWRPV